MVLPKPGSAPSPKKEHSYAKMVERITAVLNRLHRDIGPGMSSSRADESVRLFFGDMLTILQNLGAI